ncbi:MAG TPA: MarR family winged helix-turn-helix transcriptional regulator [Candidatus Binatia bacterium]|nr:MarR family winged helix-turn-helix transcriptional regulator [Candidatus Binatia bacterium]
MDRDEPIGLLIGVVRRRIKQAVGSHVRRYRLSTQQFWVLVAVHEQPGISLGEVAAHLRMDKPTASRIVFTLMNRKLLQVKGHATDRRRACLHIGAASVPLIKELHGLASAVRGAVTRGLSPAELAVLRRGLRKIVDNMDRLQRGEQGQPAMRRLRPVVATLRQ